MDDDAKMMLDTAVFLIASNTFSVPTTLMFMHSDGWSVDHSTPGFAARWMTKSMLKSLSVFSIAHVSKTLASTTVLQRDYDIYLHSAVELEKSSKPMTTWPSSTSDLHT